MTSQEIEKFRPHWRRISSHLAHLVAVGSVSRRSSPVTAATTSQSSMRACTISDPTATFERRHRPQPREPRASTLLVSGDRLGALAVEQDAPLAGFGEGELLSPPTSPGPVAVKPPASPSAPVDRHVTFFSASRKARDVTFAQGSRCVAPAGTGYRSTRRRTPSRSAAG